MDRLVRWLLPWICLGAVSPRTEGACVHKGTLFTNNTVWSPDSCKQCSCHSEVAVCQPTACEDPQCDFQRGEVLQVAANRCCPECAARTTDFCQHEGKLHGHNTEWTGSPCAQCYCLSGKVSCAQKPCPAVSCRREGEYVPEGECCPRCAGTGEPCSVDGQVLRDGEECQQSQCSKCVCSNGVIEYFTAECPPVVCDKDEHLALAPGKCCPECLPMPCSVSGKVYESGEQWKETVCTTCMCSKGQVQCHTQACDSLTCEKGWSKVKRQGRCCEECVSSQAQCQYEGFARHHGELWNASSCQFCRCDRGEVLCQQGECARVQCTSGEELVHLEGKCCPECISQGTYCIYKETSEKMTHGEKWTEGLCKKCECRHGRVTCFAPACPPCPVGVLTLNVANECCPECTSVQCHPDCLACSQTSDHCDICREAGKLLQLGSCVQKCDSGFFQEGRSCQVNAKSPLIDFNGFLLVGIGGVEPLNFLMNVQNVDARPGSLLFYVVSPPTNGHLVKVLNGKEEYLDANDHFSWIDLKEQRVYFKHRAEKSRKSFFSVKITDGQSFSRVEIVDIQAVSTKATRMFRNEALLIGKGEIGVITNSLLDLYDDDNPRDVVIVVVDPPKHGKLSNTPGDGLVHQFSMNDIANGNIHYVHDNSNSKSDMAVLQINDGYHTENIIFHIRISQKIVTAAPQNFQFEIFPVDVEAPRIVTNLGLQWLEYVDGKATSIISKKELYTVDPDTEDKHLVYEITAEPTYGFIESKLKPGTSITTFTQEHVNLGLIRYVLHKENIWATMDIFKFLVKDSKPNIVGDNVFHIQWSFISFKHTSYNVTETAGFVSVTVKRTGNLNQYAIVLCRTEQGSATSSSSMSSKPGQQDYVEYAGQVQFDEREDTKTCSVVINDDHVFENIESFTVELSMPAYALLGEVTKAKVNINDTEDEPTIQFDKKVYHTRESSEFLFAPVERKGDSSSSVSTVCYTVPKSAKGSSLYALESGSDYKSRGMSNENRIIFGPGVTMTTCDIKLIDDSEYEGAEEFEIALADVSDNARIGSIGSAKVIIDGPNDASTVSLGNSTFTVREDAGTINIPVIRHGSDLSTPTSVWCATRPSDPPSATPGIDYIPHSKKVEFESGKMKEFCTLTILDDTRHPVIEGLETFVVFLSSAEGAEISEPFQATVGIDDAFHDVPSMQFDKDHYIVREKEGALYLPVIRVGDLRFESSVVCYTLAETATVVQDFEERTNSEDSRITFLKGEKLKNCSVLIKDDSVFEPKEQFKVYLGNPFSSHWSGARIGKHGLATIIISNDEDAPTLEFEEATYQVREPHELEGVAILNVKVIRRGDQSRTSKVRCSTRDGSAQSGSDYYPKSSVLTFSPGDDHVIFKVEILSNENGEWHESFFLVLGPDDPVEAVLGDFTTATVTIINREAAGSLILPSPPIVVSLADYDHVAEVTEEGVKKLPSPGYPLVCVTPCDPHFSKYAIMKERCDEAGINQSAILFSWEVATPTDANGARSPFETITDSTPFTAINQMVLDSVYFSRRFLVRCVAKAVDKAGHVGTPLRSNIVTIGTDSAICYTPVVAGTARGFQAQSFLATLKYLDVKHKAHPNRIHISVQIPHQDGMLPLISTMPLHNLHFLLSESIYRHQHVCSNLVAIKDLKGISEGGFLDEVTHDSIVLGPGFDRPYQFDPRFRGSKTIQLYKHLNLKSCVWTFDAYYDMSELIDVCGGSVTADFQVRDSAQSFLTVRVPLYVSYIYVTAPRGWASLEHHTEMEFSFFYDTVLWRTGIQTDSVLSARLQIIRIYIREDGRLVIEFKTHAKFRGQFVIAHHTLPEVKSLILAPDHLGGIEFDLQPMWSAQTFDSPYQLWRATSSYSRKDYSGEYTIYLIPCTVQPTQPWIDPGDKPLACTAHAPERFLIPIAFQQTNRPVPVVYSLNTEFQLCNNEKMFLMNPAKSEVSLAEIDYKGAFSKGQTLYGRVLWNPDQNLNAAYKLQLEKVYLCTGKDGYVPFFDPTGTIYNEGPQYGCIQPNKNLKHRFLLLDRNQPEVIDLYFHDVPFDASFASDMSDFYTMGSMPGVDGFTMKVDALYKVETGHQWYLQVIYIIGPESVAGSGMQRSLTNHLKRSRRDAVDKHRRFDLDDFLINNNEGGRLKNGTNMKSLSLELEIAAASSSQASASFGSAFAAVALLLLLVMAVCFVTSRCRKGKKKPIKAVLEEVPLNTLIDASKKNVNAYEKNFSRQLCTVKNINLLHENENALKAKGVKVKKMNLEVKVHNNLHDGTEV